MKKQILVSILMIGLIAAFMSAGSFSAYNDTETSTGNTFTAGVLDLKVKNSGVWEDDPNIKTVSVNPMVPGQIYEKTFKLKNSGNVPGVLSIKILNPVSNENTLEEPEITDGDTTGVEIDPTGYDANSGDGELWDQITLGVWVEGNGYGGAGSHDSNNHMDWDDTKLKGFSSTQDDYSLTYSIALNTDLASGFNIVLNPGDVVTLGVAVKFIDDATSSWWGGQGSLTNNMAMSDDAQFDIEFGLYQA